jgi:type I restriction enzyme M protein
LLADLDGFRKQFGQNLPPTNEKQHAARKAFDPIADGIKDLVKQVDLLYKLTARTTDLAAEFPLPPGEGEGEGKLFDVRSARRLLKQLDEERKAAV